MIYFLFPHPAHVGLTLHLCCRGNGIGAALGMRVGFMNLPVSMWQLFYQYTLLGTRSGAIRRNAVMHTH